MPLTPISIGMSGSNALTTINACFTKVDTVETNADVTDAANVTAAGAVMVGGALGTPTSGTLTNCTGLPTAGLGDDAVTLAKMAAGTAGNLITYDASGNPAAVATGTATHVLTSNGAGLAPTFQAAAGGGGSANWTLISTTTIGGSPSVIDITGMTGHRKYMFEFECVYGSSDGASLYLRTSTDAGATFDSGASDYNTAEDKIGVYSPVYATSAFAELARLVGNVAAEGITGEFIMFDPNNSALRTNFTGRLIVPNYADSDLTASEFAGRRNAAQNVNAVRFYFNSGTLSGGKVRMFGWNE